jgi:hypothetical protein
MLESHQSLVILPSHHSRIASADFHIVLIVSQTSICCLLSIFNNLLFKVAIHFTNTTYEFVLIFLLKIELKIKNKITHKNNIIIKIINLFLIFNILIII